MKFIVVTNDDLVVYGRRFVHSLSLEKSHSGSLWTVEHYKINEAAVDGKQPVIFIGSNDVSLSYIDVLTERFRGFGTKCFYDGAKAVLIAEIPEDVSFVDLKEMECAIERKQQLFISSINCVGAVASPGIFDVMFQRVTYFLNARKRKQEYRNYQFEYLMFRFLSDELESFIRGIEARK